MTGAENPAVELVDPRSPVAYELYPIDRKVQDANALTILPLENFTEFCDMLLAARESGGDTACVRDVAGRAAGYVAFSIDRTPFTVVKRSEGTPVASHLRVMVIKSLVVDPEVQGKNYGTALMRVAEKAALERR